MRDLFRETLFGRLLRLITCNRSFQYLEETPNFQLPSPYLNPSHTAIACNEIPSLPLSSGPPAGIDEKGLINPEGAGKKSTALRRKGTLPTVPVQSKDGAILVDWYATDDPDNPQNWSSIKKAFVALQICLYTFSVYLASAIYTQSEPYVMQIFGVDYTAASLGLSMYVLGYGIGPLLFSPMSEIPIIGRNPPYLVTFTIFVILCVPTALVENLAGLVVLRFLQGFFGSPCLATGGASMSDMYSLLKLPYAYVFWVAAATCGPALGPMISGFSIPAEDWRWSLWEILWLAGPVLVLLFFCLPETSTPNILLRRAQRLRKITGDSRFRSESEIKQSKLTIREIAIDSLWKPMQILCLDPAILFAGFYTSLVYGIYYSFFEVIPLVYAPIYHFNAGEMGSTFLAVAAGTVIAMSIYCSYLYFVLEPTIRRHGFGPPEQRLVPGLYASPFLPLGLFLFGWTANVHVPWIVSVVGMGIYAFGIGIVIQCMFLYVPLSYPEYSASLFASNDFTRSALAAGTILFARPMYVRLGVGPGVSLLAAFTVACVGGILALYFYGARLRVRSRFAVS